MKPQKPQTDITIFYSYAQADQEWRELLSIHLSQLKRDKLIEEWHDQLILAGSDHLQTLNQAIGSANIILLLISAEFLASDAQYQIEMLQAMARHQRGEARVVPIIVRPCDWRHSPFAHLQCLPRNTKPIASWDNPDEAFVEIALELRRIIAQQQFPHPPLSSVQRQNRGHMLKHVRDIWIKGLLEPSLYRAARIDLNLQEQPDALENPWQMIVCELHRPSRALPAGTTIVEVYDQANGELLILGEPGSGKTTLLLQLADRLLDRAEGDECLPIPVVFNLSSWAQKQKALATWLVEELETRYQVPSQVGTSWVEAREVLPLLDGLDEVAQEARMACVQAICDYSYHASQLGAPLVVCCRNEEYQALSLHLPLQRAVSILPLTDEQIDGYLSSTPGQVEGLRRVLHDDAELVALARRPLMLSIFTLAYQGMTTVDLPTALTQEQRLHAVFRSYVQRMLNRRKQVPCWMQKHFLHWLIGIAKHLYQQHQTVFSIENLQPTWLSGSQQRFYRWSITLLLGPVLVLVLVLVGGLIFGGSGGLALGLILGLALRLYLGRRGKSIQPAEVIHLSWGGSKRFGWVWLIMFFLLFWLLGGLGVTDVAGQLAKRLPSMPSGVLPGVLLAVQFFATAGGSILGGLLFSQRRLAERDSLFPNEGIRRSGKNGLVIGLVGALIGGPPAVLFGGLPAVLFFGLSFGLSLGLSFGLAALIEHFVLRFWLWRTTSLPWNLVSFLDEAAERLLLRKVGGSYIFVHRFLLEYFATLDEPTPSESISSENSQDGDIRLRGKTAKDGQVR